MFARRRLIRSRVHVSGGEVFEAVAQLLLGSMPLTMPENAGFVR